jgi:tetratricopeptide (TPR) repeat protein
MTITSKYIRRRAPGWMSRAVAAALLMAVFLASTVAAAGGDSPDNLKDRLEGMTPEEKIAYLDKLIEDGVDDARIHFFKGNAWFTSEQYDSAIVEFGRAVELDENYAKAWVNLGIVYDQTRKFPDARRAYARALQINPDDVLAHCHLGFNYYSAGKHDKAMWHYEKALEIDPGSAQAHYNLGLAFANAKIFKEALVEWRKVVELDPDGQLGNMAAENVELIKTYMELGN